MSIVTDRLELVSVSLQIARAGLEGDASLARALDAVLPASWPPEFYGPSSLEFTIQQLEKGPEQAGWVMYYFLIRDGRVLIGYGGYKGAPAADGTVEIGYSVVDDHQRKGYATEATLGLLTRAFALPQVRRVVADTVPDRPASIRVLEKLDFQFIGSGSEEGAIRYELTRQRFT